MPTVRIPFTQPLESRTASTSKDSKSVNAYFEKRGENIQECVKRPGQTLIANSPSMTAGQAQGMYEWGEALYCVVNNVVYKTTSLLVTSTVGTITGAVHNVYWAESANHTYLFFHNGTNGYVINSSDVLTRVDNTSIYNVTITAGGSGYVSPTCTFSAPPAGVTATGTVNSSGGVITGITITNYGSGYVTAPTCTITGAPGTGATASVTLNAFPSGALNIAPGAAYLDTYTIVSTVGGQLYTSDPEYPYLWNSLNTIAAESDPDQTVGIVRHHNYIIDFGEWGTEFFYDAANTSGSPLSRQDGYKNEIGCADGNSIVQFEQAVMFVGVSKTRGKSVYVIDGVTPKRVSTRYIEKYLNADTSTSIQAHVFKIEGHTFYVMTLPNLDVTLVYDMDEKQWYQWTSYYSSAEHAYTIWCTTLFNGVTYGLHATDGHLYKIDPTVYSDAGTAIYWRVVTPRMDAGTMHRKLYRRGEVVGDATSATMTITHCGDDYVTYSSARTVSLSASRPRLLQLGQDRRRAWQFLVTDNVAIRLQAFEVDVDGAEMESDPQLGQ